MSCYTGVSSKICGENIKTCANKCSDISVASTYATNVWINNVKICVCEKPLILGIFSLKIFIRSE